MIRNGLFIVLAAVMALQASLLRAADQLPHDPALRHGTLANGLTYYIRSNGTPAGRADFRMVHRVGSVMEQDNERGLAHFLEHMAFAGTKNYSEFDLFHLLTSNGLSFGTDANATTSYDDTQYYFNNVPTQRWGLLDSLLYVLRDMSCNLTLDSTQMAKERAIIDDERTNHLSYEMRLQEAVLPVLMRGSRYANRIPIGLPQVVQSATPAQLKAFYQRWYRADRQALVIVGDFDSELMERKVRRIFGLLPAPSDAMPAIDLSVPDHSGVRYASYTDTDASSTMVNVFFKHDGWSRQQKNTLDYVRLQMTRQLVTYMLDQRLLRLTRQASCPMQYASSSDGYYIVTHSKEAFSLSAMPKRDQSLASLRQLLTEGRRAAQHGFTSTELQVAKTAISSEMQHYATQADTHLSADYVSEYIDHFIGGSYIPGIELETRLSLEALEQTTLKQVNQLVRRLISADNVCVLVAGPHDESHPTEQQVQEQVRTVLTSKVDAYSDIPVADRQSILRNDIVPGSIIAQQTDTALGITTLQLSNGARAVLKPTQLKRNEILFDAVSPGGRWACDVRHAALLKVLEPMVEDSKLGGFTQQELERILAGKMLALSFGVADDHHDLVGGCATADAELLLQLCHHFFVDVSADTAAYQAHMDRLRSQVRQVRDKPDAVVADSTVVAHYGPYLPALQLTEDDLDRADLDSLLVLYRRYVARPDQFTFILVGDFDIEQMLPLVARYLASLPVLETSPVLAATHIAHLLPGDRWVHVPQPGSDRAQLLVTTSGPINDSLRHRLLLSLYGHAAEAALNAMLREQRQLTYGVSAQTQMLRADSRWTLSYNLVCKPQQADTALQAASEALQLIADRGIAPSLFEKIIQLELRQLEQSEATNAYWVEVLRQRALYGDSLTGVAALLRGLTVDDFDAFVKGLSTDTHITIVAGP